jgi:Fe-S-cluster containining protein
MAKKLTNKEKKARTKKSNRTRLARHLKHNLTGIPKKVKLTNLDSVLQGIYNDQIDLSTTCNHKCECCRTAMPMHNYCEFVNIISKLWEELDNKEKLNLIITSIEYFFSVEYKKWAEKSLIKPCMLLDDGTGLCKIYKRRPLSCRMYGLWPKEDYEKRVDRFEKIYSQYGLKREDLPLNKQCSFVKRIDDSKPITTEVINGLFKQLDELDGKIGNFSELQISQKENYRTFHDWLLLKVLGEEWLSKLTIFMLGVDKDKIEDQINAIVNVWTKEFTDKGVPDIRERL